MSHVEPERGGRGCPECGELEGHGVGCSLIRGPVDMTVDIWKRAKASKLAEPEGFKELDDYTQVQAADLDKENWELKKQLAAERKHSAFCTKMANERLEQMVELKQQLATEREITETWGKRLKACSEDNDKLCSQLDIAVEALKQIVSYNYIDTVGRNRRVAKAALGKLEPPPRQTWNLIKT
jgi:hypothetical protein